MTMKYIELEATTEFPFSVNAPATGGASDADTAPPFDVRLQGAVASAIPVFSDTADLLSHVNFPAGQYAAIVPATAANGFAADSIYSVYCSAAVTTTTGAVIGEFTTSALLDADGVEASVDAALKAYVSTGTGVVDNVDHAARTIAAASIPSKTDVSDVTTAVNAESAAIQADNLVRDQVSLRSDTDNATTHTAKIAAINTDHGGDAGTFDPLTDSHEAQALSLAAVANLEDMFDGTGYTDPTGPASRSQVDGIGASSGGSFPIEVTEDNESSPIKTISSVGTETGTFANTEADDASYHVLTHATNDIDWIYGIDIGGARTAVGVRFKGYLTGNNDAMLLQAYDFVGADWETVKQISGQSGTADRELVADLLLKHTGTGADLGKVYVRLQADGVMTSPVMNVNLLHVDAVNIGQSVGYSLGSIWIDTVNGAAGTEAFTNGVADNAVDLIASAKTLSTSVGLSDFRVINGSLITLAESTVNESYFGDNWALALGGQDVAGAYIQGAAVSGVGVSASEVHYEGCEIGTMSAQVAHFDFCGFSGTVTQTLAGDYNYHNSYSRVAGNGAPVFTKTAGQAITAEWRNWSGGITVSTIEAGDIMTIGGRLGTVTLNGADGTVEIRGTYKAIVDNRTGAPTLNTDGAIKGADVATILVDTTEIGVAGAGLTDLGGMSTAMKAEVNTEVDGALDTAIPELAAVPSATPTIRTALMFVFMGLRNATHTTSTSSEIHNDAGAVIGTGVLSDDAVTYIKGKYA